MDGVPLKLQLAPGSYNCTWIIPTGQQETVRLPGTLDLQAARPPEGSAHGDLPVTHETDGTTRSASYPQVLRWDQLSVDLVNGLRATLLEAEMTIWFPDQAFVSARAAVLSGHDEEVLTAAAVKIQVENLEAFSSEGPLGGFEFPGPAPEQHLAGTWSVTGNPNSAQTWSDGSATVSLQYDGAVTMGDPFFFRMSFSPVIIIETDTALPFSEWLTRWLDPLRRLVSLATGKVPQITYLALRVQEAGDGSPPSASRWSQVYGSGILQKPFASRRQRYEEAQSVLRFDDEEIGLLDLLQRWNTLADEHHPLLETYGAFLGTPAQHPRSEFLLLIQCLEGFYGHETQMQSEQRRGAYRARRAQVLAAVRAASGALDDDCRNFIKKNLAKYPYVTLETALGQCISFEQQAELDRIEIIASTINGSDGDIGTALAALRVLRNDLAHGNRGYDTLQLSGVVEILNRVVRSHMLAVLGCSWKAQSRAIELP